MAPARTRLARKQNAGLWFDRLTILSEVEGLVGSQSFADTASRSRSQTKMEDNLFTSPKEKAWYENEKILDFSRNVRDLWQLGMGVRGLFETA